MESKSAYEKSEEDEIIIYYTPFLEAKFECPVSMLLFDNLGLAERLK